MACASNLRQIGTAFQMYLNDNKGVFPAFSDHGLSVVPAGFPSWPPAWFYCNYTNLLAPYLGLPNSLPTDNNWTNYYDTLNCINRPIYTCPVAGAGNFKSYYYQNWLLGISVFDANSWDWPNRYGRMSQLKDSANTIVLYDLWQTGAMTGDSSKSATPYDGHPFGTPGHNVLYADGHVSDLTKKDDSPWDSSWNIKWFLLNRQWDPNMADYPAGQY